MFFIQDLLDKRAERRKESEIHLMDSSVCSILTSLYFWLNHDILKFNVRYYFFDKIFKFTALFAFNGKSLWTNSIYCYTRTRWVFSLWNTLFNSMNFSHQWDAITVNIFWCTETHSHMYHHMQWNGICFDDIRVPFFMTNLPDFPVFDFLFSKLMATLFKTAFHSTQFDLLCGALPKYFQSPSTSMEFKTLFYHFSTISL